MWCADITYVPVSHGFFYLVAVMDWATRHVLSWQLSNTMDASFCVRALDDALRMGKPEIFNTDQGSQFTSEAFTERVLGADIRVWMDGRRLFHGRWPVPMAAPQLRLNSPRKPGPRSGSYPIGQHYTLSRCQIDSTLNEYCDLPPGRAGTRA